jgi:hypothetical protein
LCLSVHVLLNHLTGRIKSLSHITDVRHIDLFVAISKSFLEIFDLSFLHYLVSEHLLFKFLRHFGVLPILFILSVLDVEALLVL